MIRIYYLWRLICLSNYSSSFSVKNMSPYSYLHKIRKKYIRLLYISDSCLSRKLNLFTYKAEIITFWGIVKLAFFNRILELFVLVRNRRTTYCLYIQQPICVIQFASVSKQIISFIDKKRNKSKCYQIGSANALST